MGQHVFSIIELSKKGIKNKIISLSNMTNTFVANYNFNALVSSKSTYLYKNLQYYHNSTHLNNEFHIDL